MREAYANLWTFVADARVITTNGSIRRDGRLVMGRGCAAEAKGRYPILPEILGILVREYGNHAYGLYKGDFAATPLITFPVKDRWHEDAKIELIVRSAEELKQIVDRHEELKRVVLPRPGCGNGRLDWTVVQKVLEPVLDDRFTIVTNEIGT